MPAMVVPAKIRRKNTVLAVWYKVKKYMLSLTPERTNGSLHRKDQFFHGVGVDGVYLPLHKANQFLAWNRCRHLSPNDVIKMPDVRYAEENIARSILWKFWLARALAF